MLHYFLFRAKTACWRLGFFHTQYYLGMVFARRCQRLSNIVISSYLDSRRPASDNEPSLVGLSISAFRAEIFSCVCAACQVQHCDPLQLH